MNRKIHYLTGQSPDRPLIYVLRGTEGDLLIDTGHGAVLEEVDRWIDESGFRIRWIFLTHGHFDHTYNAKYFREKHHAEVILHQDDADIYYGTNCPTLLPSLQSNAEAAAMANQLCEMAQHTPVCTIDHLLSNDDTDFLRQRGFDADVVMLPGHTEGSMGILQGRVIYCGDACAAKGGDYYTALFGESVDDIFKSEDKIFALNPLVIAPGHGKLIINERAFPDPLA